MALRPKPRKKAKPIEFGKKTKPPKKPKRPAESGYPRRKKPKK